MEVADYFGFLSGQSLHNHSTTELKALLKFLVKNVGYQLKTNMSV